MSKSATTKNAIPWPEWFILTNSHADYFRRYNEGATDDDIILQFERFKNYHEARGSLFASWDAAWRTWATNCKKFGYGSDPAQVVKETLAPRARPSQSTGAIQRMKEDEVKIRAEEAAMTPEQRAINRQRLRDIIATIGKSIPTANSR